MDSKAKQIRRADRNRRQTSSNALLCTCQDPKPSSRLAGAADPRFPSWETYCSRCGHRILEVDS